MLQLMSPELYNELNKGYVIANAIKKTSYFRIFDAKSKDFPLLAQNRPIGTIGGPCPLLPTPYSL